MPHGPLGDRIPFEGVLNCWNDDHDLPDLLLAISRSGKTGRLHFSNPEGDKTLDLRGGKIVFAESSSQDDGLGQYLLRTGKISLMDYIRVSRLVQPGKRLGALLVDENVLAPEDLVPAVIGQVRSIILSLFRRTETWYRFKEEELQEKESITLDLAVPELILEGVRYVESWRRVSKGVGSLESVYQQTAEREDEWLSSHLDDGVRELVDMLTIPTSLQDICTRATLQDFEACRYLWAFRALGWIDVVDEVSVTESEPKTETQSAVGIEPEREPAHMSQIDSPDPAPSDTPTLPSIQPPIQPPAASSFPGELNETQLAIEPPADPTPPAAEPSVASVPPEIPERLIETQISATPSFDEDNVFDEPQPPKAPTPIPEHLNQTQLAIDAPTSELPEPKPLPEHLTKTQVAAEPPTSNSPPSPASPPIPDELLHTQVFVEAPPDVPAAPPSTGEFMESILEGNDPAAPPLVPPQGPPPPMDPEPPAPPNQAITQFFDGPSALEPLDADLAAVAPAPTPPEEPVPPSPPKPPPMPSAPEPPLTGTPSGFEALALGGGPSVPTAPAPTSPPPRIAAPPNPAEVATQPSVQQPPLAGDGMASFSDLALPETPAEPPVPLVEADVVTTQPAPAAAPEFTPDEPLLPPSMASNPIERESLVPRRRHADEVPPDKDEFGHILGNDD